MFRCPRRMPRSVSCRAALLLRRDRRTRREPNHPGRTTRVPTVARADEARPAAPPAYCVLLSTEEKDIDLRPRSISPPPCRRYHRRLPQMISRQHASLKVTADCRLVVKDMGSTNGTFLGDDRIQPAPISPGAGGAAASPAHSAEIELAHDAILGFGGPARVSRLGVVTENPCRFFVDARPAHVAALAGDFDALRGLIEANPALALELDLQRGCLLHAAAVGGNPAVVDWVCSRYPDMADARNSSGATPLHFAVKHGYISVTEALLRAAANPLATTSTGLTVAHVAASAGLTDLLHLLLSAAPALARVACESNGRTALHAAALKGEAEAARQLLEAGADVNAAAGDGQTALHMAVSDGQAEVLAVLLGAPGLDPALPDEVGLAPLHYAAQRGRVEVTRQLLEAGADARALANGVSVAQMAMASGFSQVADIIQNWMLTHPAPAIPPAPAATIIPRDATEGQEGSATPGLAGAAAGGGGGSAAAGAARSGAGMDLDDCSPGEGLGGAPGVRGDRKRKANEEGDDEAMGAGGVAGGAVGGGPSAGVVVSADAARVCAALEAQLVDLAAGSSSRGGPASTSGGVAGGTPKPKGAATVVTRAALVADAVRDAGSLQGLMHAAVAQGAYLVLDAAAMLARTNLAAKTAATGGDDGLAAGATGPGGYGAGPGGALVPGGGPSRSSGLAARAMAAAAEDGAARALLHRALDTILQRTTCAICMEVMVAPHTVTPCGHTFCGTCILQWVKHEAAKADPARGRNNAGDDPANGPPRISCPKCRACVGGSGVPAPALDLGAILEEVVGAALAADERAEWSARHDRWNADKGVLLTAAEEVMQPSNHAGAMHSLLRGGAGLSNGASMVRPDQPALQLSYGGHQIAVDADF